MKLIASTRSFLFVSVHDPLKWLPKVDSSQVLLLSVFDTNVRIVQAHMSPNSKRLQLRYSDFFDFRNLNQHYLDVFVRWLLNEPIPVPKSEDEVTYLTLSDDSGSLQDA